MEPLNTNDTNKGENLIYSAGWRIALSLGVAVLVVWGVTVLFGAFGKAPEKIAAAPPAQHVAAETHSPEAAHTPSAQLADQVIHTETGPVAAPETSTPTGIAHQEPVTHVVPVTPDHQALQPAAPAAHTPTPTDDSHSADTAAKAAVKAAEPVVRGVTFITAVIEPLDYELGKRAWGWRPNDLVQFTDNVNNFQRGVLEVTRRATTTLAERITRTGSTDIIDGDLEEAMNWFMVSADSYWFPAAENKYKDGLNKLRAYKDRLARGEAETSFYTRTDNIIPLFRAFADLLGSCDTNLVKAKERDGKPVSTFAADNYFYYAKGVASAMEPMLEAVAVDFQETLAIRGSLSTLHHAIHSCHVAASLEPWIVTEADLDGILANHRACMAAHISHARYYLDVLVNTLST